MNLILASQSPRRKELLELLKIPFQVIPANIPELNHTLADVPKTAYNKAMHIFMQNPEAVVIGADTVVYLGNEILEKPKDKGDAARMLGLLSGKEHIVATGVAIVGKDLKEKGLIQTKVYVDLLSPKEIEDYLEHEDVMDAAGSYKIQGFFSRHIKKIEGDYFNIVGLPVNWIYHILKNIF
jgi:septum formation protein